MQDGDNYNGITLFHIQFMPETRASWWRWYANDMNSDVNDACLLCTKDIVNIHNIHNRDGLYLLPVTCYLLPVLHHLLTDFIVITILLGS